MASTAVRIRSLSSIPIAPPSFCSTKLPNKQTLTFSFSSHLLSRNSFSGLTSTGPRPSGPVFVVAAQPNFAKIAQTAWKIGKDGVDAGTNLVPNSVPRPIARIGVTIGLLVVAQFVLRSFLSTAFFVLATMGLVYFLYLALNKDEGPQGGREGPKGGGSDRASPDDPLEEAKRIMEKYK